MTQPLRAVGIGTNEAEATKAVLAAAERFVEDPHVRLLAEDIRQARFRVAGRT